MENFQEIERGRMKLSTYGQNYMEEERKERKKRRKSNKYNSNKASMKI